MIRNCDEQCGRVLHVKRAEKCERLRVRMNGRKDAEVLHLPGDDDFGDALILENRDQLAHLADRNPMAARRELLDFRRRLLADADHHHFVSQAARRLEREQREPAVPGDHPVLAHFTNPRSEAAMKASSSSISGPISTSVAMRSTACVVLSPAFVRSRNALCRFSMASLLNPRRYRPILLSPNTFDSRGVTVSQNGSTSFVMTLYPPTKACPPTRPN